MLQECMPSVLRQHNWHGKCSKRKNTKLTFKINVVIEPTMDHNIDIINEEHAKYNCITAYHSRIQGYVSLPKKFRNTIRMHWNCSNFTKSVQKWHVYTIVKYK